MLHPVAISERLNMRHDLFRTLIFKHRSSLDFFHWWQVWNCVRESQKDFGPIAIDMDMDTDMDAHMGMDIIPLDRPHESSHVTNASCKVMPVYEEWKDYECVDFNALQNAWELKN